MAVDQFGFIVVPHYKDLQPQQLKVVGKIVKGITEGTRNLIHSIYVNYSGDFGPTKGFFSYFDVTIVLSRKQSVDESATLANLLVELERDTQVSQIDFHIGELKDVIDPDYHLSWGYLLKHHYVCVYGEDLSRCISPQKPSREIAVALNGNFREELQALIEQIKTADIGPVRRRLQRIAARSAIKATSILRREDDKDWPMTLEEHITKFILRYPALESEADYWLIMSNTPSDDAALFVESLHTFIYWLNAEYQARRTDDKPL